MPDNSNSCQENQNHQDQETTVKTECLSFWKDASIAGISGILKAKNNAMKIVSILVLLVSLGVLLWNCIMILITYFSYPVDLMYKEGESRPTFPDVTICRPFTIKDESTYFKNETALDKDYYDYMWWKIMGLDSYYVNSQSREDNSSSFIIDSNCIDWDWDVHRVSFESRSFWDFDYGECITLHSNSSDPTDVRGLSLILFNDNNLTMYTDFFFLFPDNANAHGMRVTVHAPGTRPDLKNGITVGFGTETTFRLKNTNRIRLPSPHGNCTDQKHIDDSDPKSFVYTKDICYEVCLQEQFMKECNCMNNNFFYTSRQNESVKGTICGDLGESSGYLNIENVEGMWQMACMVKFKPNLDLCEKNCPMPCSEHQYDISETSAPWPQVSVQLAFYKRYINGTTAYGSKFDIYGEILHNFTNGDLGAIKQLENIHYLEENFIQLNLVFDSYTMAVMEDQPSMTLSGLFCALGGSMSMWLGISIMTGFEFLLLFYNLVVVTRRQCRDTNGQMPKDRRVTEMSYIPPEDTCRDEERNTT